MRMANVRTRPINGNVLSMRISRMMDDYMIIFTWRGTKDWVHPTRDQSRRMDKLDAEALAKNSTRRYTPGLCYPELGETGGRVPVPVDHRKRSRGSYARKTFVRKAARASRAVTTRSDSAAKKRKAAVKGPSKAKKPRLVVKLPVRVALEDTKLPKFEDDADKEDDIAEDDTIEDEMYEDDMGEEDVDDDPSSYYEDEDPNASADEDTVYSTPEKRVKIESSPLAQLASTQTTPAYPFARPVDTLDLGPYSAQLNYQNNHPYELPYATPYPELKHIDPRNIYNPPSQGYMPHFSAPQPVEPFDFGGNTSGLEDPFQATYPAPRVGMVHTVFRGLYSTGLNFAPRLAPTVPSNNFNFGASALDPSLPMGSFRVGYNNFVVNDNNVTINDNSLTTNNNNLTVNELLQDDAPHEQANEQDYADDTYWFPQH